MASLRVISLVKPFARVASKNSTTKAVEISKRMGSSFLTVSLLTLIGQNNAPTPMSSKALIILLPITLPSNISVEPEANELIETANSGALVPNATMVRPIKVLETLKLVAIDEAPSTNQSAPLIRMIKPVISSIICNNISMFVFDKNLHKYYNMALAC